MNPPPTSLPITSLWVIPMHQPQPWDFFGKNEAKAEAPVLWPPHAKSWLTGKDSDAGRNWGQEEKGTTEDEMAGWHHWLDGHESEWTPGVGDGQGGLACCNSWGHKYSDMTEQLNWNEQFFSCWNLLFSAPSGESPLHPPLLLLQISSHLLHLQDLSWHPSLQLAGSGSPLLSSYQSAVFPLSHWFWLASLCLISYLISLCSPP